MKAQDFEAFFNAYLECALWSSTDSEGEPLDAVHSADDIAPESIAKMRQECQDFIEIAGPYLELTGSGMEQHGHDFWLTRNGHGAGFWDRGYGATGKTLADLAKSMGAADLYIGDDFNIHHS